MFFKVVSLVSYKMHKTRRDAVTACVKSLLNGSAATVTSIGRGISTKAFEKHRIKRADRLLSNPHLLSETPLIYASICQSSTLQSLNHLVKSHRPCKKLASKFCWFFLYSS